VFERLRQSLREAMDRATSPAEGRAVLALMRDALVEAKVGLADLRSGIELTRKRLDAERRELETVRRRGRLASEISDAETVTVAARYERHYVERVAVLEQKLAAQESELSLAEREFEEMTAQFKAAGAGVGIGDTARVKAEEPTDEEAFDRLRRATERATREADAERRLQELKRRMGK
jgi:hypothetical protein